MSCTTTYVVILNDLSLNDGLEIFENILKPPDFIAKLTS